MLRLHIMEMSMSDLIQDVGRISDQRVWSEIHYLDPERNCQNDSRPIVGIMIAMLAIWVMFFAALYHLIR
jgi:hypothetical protein